MFSFPTWPRLPSVSLPDTIQRRFLSFLLKKSLGHLVKPGQLDPAQIDAQIGSGFVHVNNVELDHNFLNERLSDLALPFRLEAGFIGKVSARIPWPNLTAPLVLSLSSISLTFVHAPQPYTAGHPSYAKDDLTGSVASMAESFVHEELSAGEDQSLRDSLHMDTKLRQPPGSIDPFLSTEDLDAGRRAKIDDEDGENSDDAEPSNEGVSLIATLIERLLSRFEFDVSDVTLRVVLPCKAEFVLRVGQVTYNTEDVSVSPGSLPERGAEDGEFRIVKVTDISIFTRDLTPLSLPHAPACRHRSASPFDSSSSSEEDEEVMMKMSQSLASLPPPPFARSISPESTMYHSATSSLRSDSPELTETQEKEAPEDKIVSLGLGSDPVVLRLVTPPLVVPATQVEVGQTQVNNRPQFRPSSANKIRLTITTGSVAVALNPVHARSLQHLSSVLARSHTMNPPRKPQNSPGEPISVTLHSKRISLLFLRLPPPFLASQTTKTDPLHDFFSAKSSPSSPPRIPHLRIQFDVLEVLSTALPTTDDTFRRTSTIDHSPSSTPEAYKHLFKASLSDLSIFAFVPSTGQDWYTPPILISDPHLGTTYDRDTSFPSFDVVDWTKTRDTSGSGKVSNWRVRVSRSKRRSIGVLPPDTTGSSRISHIPVLQARLVSGTAVHGAVCEIDVVPLHLFVDAGIAEGAVNFLDTMTALNRSPDQGSRRTDKESDLEETPPATPRARGHTAQEADNGEIERRRLENLVMDDFAANDEGGPSVPAPLGVDFILRLPFFRVEVRAPPPLPWSNNPRSGALVLDLHDVRVTQQGEEPSRRGMEHAQHRGAKAGPKVLCNIELRRLLAAATAPGESRASTFLSVAAQASVSEVPSTFGMSATSLAHSPSVTVTPLPSVCVRSNTVSPHQPSTTRSPGAGASFSLDTCLPSVHVTLSKPVLDGLTFWADDIAQCLYGDIERASTSDASGRSRDPSLIGSRFFARRTASAGSSESGGEGRKSELVAKVFVGEALIKLLVPREGAVVDARPLDIEFSDVDLLAEIKPEGKDETVVTVGIMDLRVCDTSSTGEIIVILGLTIPRQLITSSGSFIKLRYLSLNDMDTAVKESRLKLTVSGFTYFFTPDIAWITDMQAFAKTPEGAFESVIPSERTMVAIKVTDSSFHIVSPQNSGALVASIGELDVSTDLVGDSPETVITALVPSSHVFFIDDINTSTTAREIIPTVHSSVEYWKRIGYALLAEISDLGVHLRYISEPSKNTQAHIDSIRLKLHACADSLPALGIFLDDLSSVFQDGEDKPSFPRQPTNTASNLHHRQKRDVFASVDEHAFLRVPGLGPAPDMIHDDLPTNPYYLDASFGAAAGLRELRDDDLFDFEPHEPTSGQNTPTAAPGAGGIISNLGGETIRILDPRGIHVVEGHFEHIPEETTNISSGSGDAKLSIRVRNFDLTVSLYDGYDWLRTRKTIEEKMKAIRRRLVKIRQLLASGQTPDDSIEETSAILFNSVSIGLPQGPEELEPNALIAAIDEELNDETESETASQSSWQSFKPPPQQGAFRLTRLRGKKLGRSRGSQIDFCLFGIQAEVDQFHLNNSLASRVLITVRDLEILDHIKTSTWKKFLTELRTDFRGNVRETASDMARAELRIVRPVPDLPTEEGRLRAKVLPIKLHVDQDALDFMKKFFSFQDLEVPVASDSVKTELYFQHVEVFPVDIKLDYKPKRVDYKALREGKTIELMNFFHFDGAEITLRHITLSGISGWPRLFDTLNDLWTPDVKANQLADIISGVSPVRSLVNVGSGVADLVLLPIAQYKKDKRVVRGVQKGTTSFVKSTAMEAIKLGARLATGTQIILEQAETVLGGQGQFRDSVTAEALQAPYGENSDEESEAADLISKYADQPQDVREGMQTAYRTLSKNFTSAAQTILAVPMEVYERSGNEGPVRAVVRAVPIAVLKPMIGASEAVSKTLFGLRNTMDPEAKHENEAKYKQR